MRIICRGYILTPLPAPLQGGGLGDKSPSSCDSDAHGWRQTVGYHQPTTDDWV